MDSNQRDEEEPATQRVDVSDNLHQGQEVTLRFSPSQGASVVSMMSEDEEDISSVHVENPSSSGIAEFIHGFDLNIQELVRNEQDVIPMIDLEDEDDEVEVIVPDPEIQVLSVLPPNRAVVMPPPPPPAPKPPTVACFNHQKGCTLRFLTNMARNKHLPKCVYSVLNECKDAKCVIKGWVRYDTWGELVSHAKIAHKCPSIKGTGLDQIRLQVNLKNDLFLPKKGDFTARILATYEEMLDGAAVEIAFVGVVQDGQDYFWILPVLCGKSAQVWHYFRLTFSLSDHTGRPLYAIEPLPHDSHNLKDEGKVICRAYCPGKPVFDAINSNQLLKFSKDNLTKSTADVIQLRLSFTTLTYRCIIKLDRELMVKPYLLSPEEVVNETSVQEMMNLKGGTQERTALAITGILLPQFRAGYNLLVQSNEFKQVLWTLFTTVLETKSSFTAAFDDPKSPSRRPLLLILFPSHFMVKAMGLCIHEMGKAIGLNCTIYKSHDDQETVARLIADGCDVLVTSSLMFSQLCMQKQPTLPDEVVFQNLKFVLVPNSDYLLRAEERNDIKICFQTLHKKVNPGLVKLTVTPLLCMKQSKAIELVVFMNEKYLTILLGPKHTTQLKPLPIFEVKIPDVSDKLEMVVKIIRAHDLSIRWLVLAPETDQSYSENFGLLIQKILQELPYKASIVIRRDESTYSEPFNFDSFEIDPGSVLLSSYFCLNYDEVKNHTEGIIMFKMPTTYADVLRILPIAKSLNKPIYALRDGSVIERTFFDN